MSPYLPPAPSHRLLSSSVHVTIPSSRSLPPASLLCLSLSDLFKSNHLSFCQGLVQAPSNLCDIVFIDTNWRDNVDHIAMFTLLGKQDTLLPEPMKEPAGQGRCWRPSCSVGHKVKSNHKSPPSKLA